MRPLPRTLGVFDLTLLVVGTVIGSGIFLVPGGVLRQAGGRVALALAIWVVGGVLSLLGALTYGELAAMKPEAGGLYVYIRDAFGPLAAFLYGWTLFFVISSGSVATLAVAFASHLRELTPLGAWGGRAVAVAMIAVVAAVNLRGTRTSAGVQNGTTALKVGALLLMSGLLLAKGAGAADDALPEARLDRNLAGGLGVGLVGVLWAYEGWQYVTFSAGETVDPQHAFPRGIVAGTAVTMTIYLIANVAYVAALGPARVAQSNRVAAEAVGAVLGGGAGKLVAAAILVSIFSATNGLTLTAPRVYFAMARDGVFFRRLADIHPRFGTPAFAVALSSAWAALLAASGTFEQLLTYVVFAGWAFYALAGLSLFYYRRQRPDLPRPFKVPGYPWAPWLFVLSAVGIVVNTLLTQPGRALVGVAVVLAGIPAFWLWRRNSISGGRP
jgi:APA family basic amino acid/polyamine antiporter